VSAVNARCQLSVLERHTPIHYTIKELRNIIIWVKFVSEDYEVNETWIPLYVGLKSLE
jgi:hypothetical protein